MNDPLLNTVIGERYRLMAVVGQGGMGIVYRAADIRLADRPCAIKLLMGTSMDPEEGIRFERELAIISRLRSNHVVQVLDTGSLADGRRFIVMELLEGLPLQALLKNQGALEVSRAIAITCGVLAALTEAHEHGVVHRDLKPANVFISRARTGQERAKVLDFGIAKDIRSHGTELTAASMLIGTPKYMAPEQFLKQGADLTTDLYAVGLLLYQMLAGRPPFVPDDPVPESMATMPPEFRVGWLHVNQMPAPLGIAPGLWAILARLLAKQPTERYPSAQSVLDALAAWQGTPMSPVLDPSGPMLLHPQENSSTTGFPVVGESMSTPLGAPSSGRAGLWIAVMLLVGLGGGAAWFLAQGPEPMTPGPEQTPVRAVGEGTCIDYLKTTPEGARVLQAGKPMGLTPLEVHRPCREVWRVTISLRDYQEESITLRGRAPREEISVPLKLEPKPAPPLAPPARPRTAAPATEAAAPKTTARPKRSKRRATTRKPPTRRAPARRPPATPKSAAPRTRAPATESPLPF